LVVIILIFKFIGIAVKETSDQKKENCIKSSSDSSESDSSESDDVLATTALKEGGGKSDE